MPKGSDKTFLEKLKEIENRIKYGNSHSTAKYFDFDQHNVFSRSAKKQQSGTNKVSPAQESSQNSETENCSGNTSDQTNLIKNVFEISKIKDSFFIEHYAGKVEYIVDQWLKKNKDPHFDYLSNLMRESKNSFVQELFTFNSSGKKGFFRSVAQKHKDSLNLLMNQLRKTNPYFVRCIIPNNEKKSNYIVNNLVLNQLKCNGVMEGIRISRQGYPTRILFKEFRKRYEILCGYSKGFIDNKDASIKIIEYIQNEVNSEEKNKVNNAANEQGNIKQSESQEEFKIMHLDNNSYKIGNTMIFFKQGVLAEIEDLREKKINEIAIELQSLIRKKLTLKKFYRKEIRKKAVTVIQKNARLSLQFRNWNWWKLYQKVKPLLEFTKMDDEIKSKELTIKELNDNMELERARNEEIKILVKRLENEKNELLKAIENERIYLIEKEDLLTALRNDNSKMKDEIVRQNEEINKIAENNKEISTLNNKILDDINNKEAEIKTISTSKKELENKIQNMINENKSLNENLIKLNAELNNSKIKSKTEKDALLIEKEKEIGHIKLDIEEMKKSNAKANESIIEKNETVENLIAENNTFKNEIDMATKNCEELKKELLCLENNNTVLSEKNKNLNTFVENMKKEIEDLTIENEKAQKENASLEKKNKKLLNEVNQSNESLKNTIEKNTNLLAELDAIKRNYVTLKNELEEEIESKNMKSQSEEQLLSQVKNLKEKNESLNDELNELQEQNENLKHEKERIVEENKKLLQSKLDDIFERENEFNAAKRNLKTRIQELENRLKNSNDKVESKQLENEIEKRKKIELLLKEQERKNLVLYNEIESLKMEKDDSNKKIKLLESELKNKEDKNIHLKNYFAEIERIRDFINNKVSKNNKEFLEILNRYRNDKSQLEERNCKLEEKLVDLESLNKKYATEMGDLKTKVELLEREKEEEIKKYSDSINSINNHYESIKEENSNIKLILEGKDNTINKMKNEYSLLQKQFDVEKGKIEQKQKQYEIVIEESRNKICNLLKLKNTLEDKLIGLKNIKSFSGFYLCDHCSVEECICDENCVEKCMADYKYLKVINDLKIKLEAEQERNSTLGNKCNNLEKNYNKFSAKFERICDENKENKNLIQKLNNDLKIQNDLVELKNNEIIISMNELKLLRNELNLNKTIIKNLEYQKEEYNKKNDEILSTIKDSSKDEEIIRERKKREHIENKITQLEKEIVSIKGTNEEYIIMINEKDLQVKDLLNETSNWKKELLEARRKCNELTLTIKQLEREIEEERSICENMKLLSRK